MPSLEDIYTKEWFEHDFAELQPEFNVVADAIYREFNPSHVFDVGCGPGMLLGALTTLGVTVGGIEGSKHGIEYARPELRNCIAHADITTLRKLTSNSWGLDLVICTEVAEHLDEKDAPGLVELLCSAMCPIVFTAAPPGQEGHHHVNCQPQVYWDTLFRAHGVIRDEGKTYSLKQRWWGLKRLSHMAANVTVYK